MLYFVNAAFSLCLRWRWPKDNVGLYACLGITYAWTYCCLMHYVYLNMHICVYIFIYILLYFAVYIFPWPSTLHLSMNTEILKKSLFKMRGHCGGNSVVFLAFCLPRILSFNCSSQNPESLLVDICIKRSKFGRRCRTADSWICSLNSNRS